MDIAKNAVTKEAMLAAAATVTASPDKAEQPGASAVPADESADTAVATAAAGAARQTDGSGATLASEGNLSSQGHAGTGRVEPVQEVCLIVYASDMMQTAFEAGILTQ